MRPRPPPVAALAVVLLLLAVAAVLLRLEGEADRSDVSAEARPTLPSRPTAPAPVTPTFRPTPTPTSPPTATATAQPTSTPAPRPAIEPPPAPPAEQQPPPPREWLDVDFTARVLALVNGERSARGLPPLPSNGALTQAARQYARTLLQFDSLSHSADGTTLLSRVRAAGYGGGPLAEVLWRGVGALPPEETVAGWMDSAPHRAIILDPTYREVGIGCYFRDDGGRLEARCVMDLAG